MDKLKDFSTDDFKPDSGTNITWAVFKNKLVKALNAIKDKINEIIAGKCEVVVGSYVGKCELKENEFTSQMIDLGFRPDAVEVYTSSGRQGAMWQWDGVSETRLCGGMALDGAPLQYIDRGVPYIAIEIIDEGFICRNYRFSHRNLICACEQGATYYYKAYKNCTRKDFS